MKRTIIASAALGLATIGLAACSENAPVEEAEPAGIPGLRITDGRLVLNAVEGNPAAVYFNLAYDGERGLAIRSADVAGAESAMLHEYADNRGVREMMEALPITLKQGTELAFEPGSRHVMVMGPSSEWKSGDSVDVTLTVSGGGSTTFSATIEAAGERED